MLLASLQDLEVVNNTCLLFKGQPGQPYPLTRTCYKHDCLRITFQNFRGAMHPQTESPGQKDFCKELRVKFVSFKIDLRKY